MELHRENTIWTLDQHLEEAKHIWRQRVGNLAIYNMRDLSQKEGLIPQSFSVSGSGDNSLRLLLREFGWDV